MIITHCSKSNFDRQKPTLGKMYETNSDGYLNFFLHSKKYFRLKSFWESLPILNHEAPTIFFYFWDPLSKLGVTVEVSSFDGTIHVNAINTTNITFCEKLEDFQSLLQFWSTDNVLCTGTEGVSYALFISMLDFKCSVQRGEGGGGGRESPPPLPLIWFAPVDFL